MATYEYECKKCGNTLEVAQKITDRPLTKCPKCEDETLIRLISVTAPPIFKGKGWYETDYKKKS